MNLRPPRDAIINHSVVQPYILPPLLNRNQFCSSSLRHMPLVMK